MSRLLPDDSPRSIGIALALGAASSSCSYAAVAIARSIFRKGANFTAAMAFEIGGQRKAEHDWPQDFPSVATPCRVRSIEP